MGSSSNLEDWFTVPEARVRVTLSAAKENQPGVFVVKRAVQLLFALSSGPKTLTELCRQTAIPLSTVRRLLKSLTYESMVLHDPLRRVYLLGPGALRLTHGAIEGTSRAALLPIEVLQQLRNRIGETVAVHVRMGSQRVCIEEYPSHQAVRYVSGIGRSAPVWLGSAGHVLLAYCPSAERRELLHSGILDHRALGRDNYVDRLERRLRDVRARGFGMSEQERVQGAAAISVPIFDGNGACVASLSALGPIGRFDRGARFAALDSLREAAEAGRLGRPGSGIVTASADG